MTHFDLVKWRDLPSRDRQAWASVRAAEAQLRSPYFDLAWFDAVDRARGDLQVVRAWSGGRAVAFFAFHPGRLGAMRPAGGTFCDWHGFVAQPGARFDVRDAIAAGMATLRFEGAPAGDALLAPWAEAHGRSNLMNLTGGFEAYARPLGRGAPKSMSEFRRASRKLESDGREVTVLVRDPDPTTLAALMRLKSEQYRRSHHPDALSWAWSRRLMKALTEIRSDDFEAVVSSLWIDKEMAAAHLGLRSGGVLHYWLPVYDPKFANYAPGTVLAVEIARALASEGVVEIDLGAGATPWKSQFANAEAPLIRGVVHANSLPGRLNAAAYSAGRRWAALPIGPAAALPHRVSRKIEKLLAPLAAEPA